MLEHTLDIFNIFEQMRHSAGTQTRLFFEKWEVRHRLEFGASMHIKDLFLNLSVRRMHDDDDERVELLYEYATCEQSLTPKNIATFQGELKKDVAFWVDLLKIDGREERYTALDSAARGAILAHNRITFDQTSTVFQLFRQMSLSQDLAHNLRNHRVCTPGSSRYLRQSALPPSPNFPTFNPRGLANLWTELNKKPTAPSCGECGTLHLQNFVTDPEEGVKCMKCYKPKQCAKCAQTEITEFYTSLRDQRDICGKCFRDLNEKSLARERGFRINGRKLLDNTSEAMQQALLKKRRVANSVVFAQGLRADGLAKTQRQASKLMREAGCRYISEALVGVVFSPTASK